MPPGASGSSTKTGIDFVPGGAALHVRTDNSEEGYTLQPLTGGDWIIRVRHVTSGELSIRG